ncbi:MAG: hypothetical protein JEZ04_04740 [Spirochaetales bacterium]|nr:hypothetical protein [Spirochaetales bacterium]
MNHLYRNIIWILKGVKVFVLVGKSGTGKSFRSKLIADKYGIELLIDDGLLIKGKKIIAGKSAKKEPTYLGAIKTALFDDSSHRDSVVKKLKDEKFKRILIIGTSERMTHKIAARLDLPAVSKIIQIEDIATTEEINTAIRSRNLEGKHVIPVPAVEINRNYSQMVYDSVKVFMEKKFLSFTKKGKYFEKTVVRPEFNKKGRVSISEPALAQMVLHCADEFDSAISIKKVTVREEISGYILKIDVKLPYGIEVSNMVHGFREYLVDNLERYSGIMIDSVSINVEDFFSKKKKV